jgi:hypothetical protein
MTNLAQIDKIISEINGLEENEKILFFISLGNYLIISMIKNGKKFP